MSSLGPKAKSALAAAAVVAAGAVAWHVYQHLAGASAEAGAAAEKADATDATTPAASTGGTAAAAAAAASSPPTAQVTPVPPSYLSTSFSRGAEPQEAVAPSGPSSRDSSPQPLPSQTPGSTMSSPRGVRLHVPAVTTQVPAGTTAPGAAASTAAASGSSGAERSFVLLKPDALQRGKVGATLQRIEVRGGRLL